MLVTLGSLSLSFASRMAPQDKEGEMLSTEEWQRNQQLISQIYTQDTCKNLSLWAIFTRILGLPQQAAMQLKSGNSGTPNCHSTFAALS